MSREPHFAGAAYSFPGTVPFHGEDAVPPSSRMSLSEPPILPTSRMAQVAKSSTTDSRSFIFRLEHTVRRWALLLLPFPSQEETMIIDLESGLPFLLRRRVSSPGSALALTKNIPSASHCHVTVLRWSLHREHERPQRILNCGYFRTQLTTLWMGTRTASACSATHRATVQCVSRQSKLQI